MRRVLATTIFLTATTLAAEVREHSGHTKQANTVGTKEDVQFSSDISSLPVLKETELIYLKDGQTYSLRAYPVKQELNGTWIRRLSYNGMIPGPILRAPQGAKVKIILENGLDLETTLHPHGLRIPEKFDGVPGVGQSPIKPGEKFTYELNLDDAGTYWYHPHVRDDYTQDAGLYGMIIVDPREQGVLPTVDKEFYVVLDDLGATSAQRAYYVNKSTHTLMGRFGELPLLNGRVAANNPILTIDQGSRVRFFILNAANSRTFRFALSDTPVTLRGSDGGFFEMPETVKGVTLGPSERYTVDATFVHAGVIRLLNDKPSKPWTMGQIVVRKDPKAMKPSIEAAKQTKFGDWQKVLEASGKKPDYELKLTIEMDHAALPMTMMEHEEEKSQPTPGDPFFYRGRTSGIEWDDEMAAMNAKSNNNNVTWQIVDAGDSKTNMQINWKLKKGRLYKIRVVNDANSMHPMQHPLHFHGQHFAVTAVNGVSNKNLTWKDTVLIGKGDTVDLVLDASNAGRWMAHCHILEHIAAQMMMGFSVTE